MWIVYAIAWRNSDGVYSAWRFRRQEAELCAEDYDGSVIYPVILEFNPAAYHDFTTELIDDTAEAYLNKLKSFHI